MDWRNNPSSITYKLNKSSSEETINANQIIEFRIYNTDNFYRRHTITKDIVEPFFDKMDLRNSLILLKVLVDGQFDLLELHTNGEYYFFYEKDDKLIFLHYEKTIDKNNRVIENAKYKNELFENLKCDDFKLGDYSNLKYNNTTLSNFFSDYNECNGSDYLNLHEKRTKTKFNLKIRGGVNLTTSQTGKSPNNYNLSYTTPIFSGNQVGEDRRRSIGNDENYKEKVHFSFGLEFEARFPIDHNNWSGFIGPNYHSISETSGGKSFSEPNVVDVNVTSNLSYSFIQIPIGFRRFFKISNNLEMHAHLAYTHNIVLNYEYDSQITDTPSSSTPYVISNLDSDKPSNSGGYFGIGINFLQKYGVEINYYSFKVNLKDEFEANLKGFSVNAFYRLF